MGVDHGGMGGLDEKGKEVLPVCGKVRAQIEGAKSPKSR
jgi:hypothetical protein